MIAIAAVMCGATGAILVITGAPTSQTRTMTEVDEWRIIAGLGLLLVAAVMAVAFALLRDDE